MHVTGTSLGSIIVFVIKMSCTVTLTKYVLCSNSYYGLAYLLPLLFLMNYVLLLLSCCMMCTILIINVSQFIIALAWVMIISALKIITVPYSVYTCFLQHTTGAKDIGLITHVP